METMTGPEAVKALIDLCDKIAGQSMLIEGDARAGRGMTAAEVLSFASGVREMSQNVGTMMRLILAMATASQGGE